jgi:ribulose-5-phosphate 4-epimerase/fuculose-1-phosphate aldolase
MPLTQTAMLIRDELSYHHFEGVALDPGEQERLVADLGSKHAMILRNHGTLAVGRTIGEAFIRLYYLERACQAQCLALAGGTALLNHPPQGTPEKSAEQGRHYLPLLGDQLAWPALLRKAERLDASFRT